MTTIINDPYDIGDRPTIKAEFVNDDGEATDPTAITYQIKSPGGAVTVEDETDATNPTVGEWRWPIPQTFDASGTWYVRVEATAGIQTAEELTLEVGSTQFA
jgi:hypothetical protein